ncbi:hypothetical protein MNBD_UNCLBAC01-1747 [hydrothermal vent metagenome]|uniref:Uncharacterized protein n=1 Tax=hydrothermal vent metagenome TaxID=652676 RepID=A0A3B1DHF0_9ZZZZ
MLNVLSKVFIAFLFIPLMFLVIVIRGDFPVIREKLSKQFLFSTLIHQRDEIQSKTQTTMLNQAISPSHYLAALLAQEGEIEELMITSYNGYLQYYKTVLKYFPRNAQAYALLGFSYYHLGDYENSIEYYEKALFLDQSFFWTYYNLGIVYLKTKQYGKAFYHFKAALDITPEDTLKKIYFSKIYQQIRTVYDLHYPVEIKLREGYQKCKWILVMIPLSLKQEHSNISSLLNSQKMYLQIF